MYRSFPLLSRADRCILPLAALVVGLVAQSAVHAQATIRNATIIGNTAGSGTNGIAGRAENMVNQSGLSQTYTSGVTLFDTYLAANPTHSTNAGTEWFSMSGFTSSAITYDLGAVYTVDRLALWNEETTGIATLAVSTSNDATFATSSAVGSFVPVNNPNGSPYAAEVFTLQSTTARYVRLQVTGPQPPSTDQRMAIGEVAFSTSAAAPEPGSIALLLTAGVPALGLVRRRVKHRA